jgi:hypothetical protein
MAIDIKIIKRNTAEISIKISISILMKVAIEIIKSFSYMYLRINRKNR